MALLKCRECGAEVSDLASKRPHCGVGTPSQSSAVFLRIVAVLIVGLRPRDAPGTLEKCPNLCFAPPNRPIVPKPLSAPSMPQITPNNAL